MESHRKEVLEMKGNRIKMFDYKVGSDDRNYIEIIDFNRRSGAITSNMLKSLLKSLTIIKWNHKCRQVIRRMK